MNPNDVEILLVEDSPDDADLALHSLRKEKLANSILVAHDGEEALDFIFCRGEFAGRTFENPPKLVLLDLKLPKVDGMQVLQAMKSDPRTKLIPVVILTSSKEERDLISGYDLGVNSFIQKPVDFDQFRETVKRVAPLLDGYEPAAGAIAGEFDPCSRQCAGEMTTAGAKTATKTSAQGKHGLEVLIIEDSLADSELILRELRRSAFDAAGCVVRTPGEFRARLKEALPDIILADYNLGQWRGMDALKILQEGGLDIPLILVSGSLGDETAVECIKQGVTDYVLKDKLGRLPSAIHRALVEKRLRSERKEAEANLARKVEELARSNRDLEQFAYIASHDLQEPLRMVSAYTQLLSERYRGKLDEQADKYIDYAVDGATRMQDLIHDLLRFSRVGRTEMVLQATDCNSVVAQAVANLKASLDETGSTVTYGHLPVLMANGPQLEQVFQNLIGNAIKFRDGAIPVIEIGAELKGDNWVFFVCDNGIGIAPENAEVIFSIFQRLHTRTEYSGNGIGLAICKKIIEQHGGKIWLGSHRGPGCTFNFNVPAMENEVSKTNDEDQRGTVGGR